MHIVPLHARTTVAVALLDVVASPDACASAQGVRFTFVNGVAVIDDGAETRALPGRAARDPDVFER